jgi:predicted esterase
MRATDFVHLFEPPRAPGAPVLLLLHGTGGNEHDLVGIGQELRVDAGLLSPRGQVLERGMPRFFRRLAEGVFDLDDLRARTGDLAAFVAAAAQEYTFDPRTVIAVGFSNGANMAASLLLLSPQTLAGAVLFRAMVPIVPEPLPSLPHTPVYMSSGLNDPLVPQDGTERLAELLRQAGAEVTLAWQATGHGLTRADVTGAVTWLERLPLSSRSDEAAGLPIARDS